MDDQLAGGIGVGEASPLVVMPMALFNLGPARGRLLVRRRGRTNRGWHTPKGPEPPTLEPLTSARFWHHVLRLHRISLAKNPVAFWAWSPFGRPCGDARSNHEQRLLSFFPERQDPGFREGPVGATDIDIPANVPPCVP